MNERSTGFLENEHGHRWIPLREKGPGYQPELEFGRIKWNPNFIYGGHHLAIDIQEANVLMNFLKINTWVEIAPLNIDKEDFLEPGNPSPNGETTIASSISRSPKQPASFVSAIPGEKTRRILINFENLYDRQPTKNPNDNLKDLGKQVDTAFKKALPVLLFYNFIDFENLTPEAQVVLAVDAVKFLGNSLNFSVAALAVAGRSIALYEVDPQLLAGTFSLTILANILFNEIVTISAIRGKGFKEEYKHLSFEYLEYLSKSEYGSRIAKVITPHYLFDNYFTPLLRLKLWNKPVFKTI